MAATPRPASTIVLMDEHSRVYLTQRPKTMKFMGGYYVFPGGAVEKGDYDQDIEYMKNLKHNELFDDAHYIAATRELFEEVGVLLCTGADGNPVQLSNEAKMEKRRQLINGELSFLQLLQNESLYLNLNDLTYFGHIITPEMNPIRFDTRFFIAMLPTGQLPKPELTEIDAVLWTAPEDALSANKEGRILLAPPTVLSLKTILNHQNGKPLMIPEITDVKKFLKENQT